MADRSANRSPSADIRTICLPCAEEQYHAIVTDPQRFRAWLNQEFQCSPELFPELFAQGFHMADRRLSKKLGLPLRRIQLRDGTRYTVRPSFVMPYMTATTADVDKPLLLRKFGVPFWALAYVFGHDPMFWFRLECQLGRASLVGTTVRKAKLPQHLLADEHHQTRQGDKVYLATTVAGGCCLGAEVANAADTDALAQAYGVFAAEARQVEPDYTPETVSTDGWTATHAAWSLLFPTVVLLRCFLHAWLKIRDRGKNLHETFRELSQRVWHTYHADSKRSFAQRLRHLKRWAEQHLRGGAVLEAVRELCAKKHLWMQAYDHPQGHRTSNMLDRVMRPMYRYFCAGQHLHGKDQASRRHVRGWALVWNFAPWNPAISKAHHGWQSPAERLNQHRYHDNWLQNLLISSSLGGYRIRAPQKA